MADATSSSSSRNGPRTYRGLSNREQTGWVLGVTPLQAAGCVGLFVGVETTSPEGLASLDKSWNEGERLRERLALLMENRWR